MVKFMVKSIIFTIIFIFCNQSRKEIFKINITGQKKYSNKCTCFGPVSDLPTEQTSKMNYLDLFDNILQCLDIIQDECVGKGIYSVNFCILSDSTVNVRL